MHVEEREMPTEVKYFEQPIGEIVVGHLQLSSRSGYNPITPDAISALRAHLKRLDNSKPPLVVVISAVGRAFCAGADLKIIKAMSPDEFRVFTRDVLLFLEEMMRLSKPVISMVHGDAMGAGAAIAQFSDFVIAANTARFAFPEILRGLTAPGYMAPRLIGRQRAAEMTMTGRTYSAEEMLGMGQVNEACAPEDLDSALSQLLNRLTAIAPYALALAKQSLRNGIAESLDAAMAHHLELQTSAFAQAKQAGFI